jgi:hypothetical protein
VGNSAAKFGNAFTKLPAPKIAEIARKRLM